MGARPSFPVVGPGFARRTRARSGRRRAVREGRLRGVAVRSGRRRLLFADESEASVRDLAAMMLTISDNTATDLLAARAGLDRVAATLAELGLAGTVIPCTLREMLDAVGREAGLAGWAELAAAPDMGERLRGPLRAIHTIRTTPADMARLLRLIWRGEAGPEEACAAVRELMARQVTRQRLAMGFPHDVRVAAKSGSLFGVVRNEIGVVRLPDGRRYAAAVFTRAERPYVNEHAINAAIGAAAAAAVQALRGEC
ncbi:hypothetical protein FH608_012870 [Nonomuraea phyllanthi]|uniref:Beta-lactamase class A catalytic domain-containing protein n=1 Tax=Nonomuraea phyllanthi TaxID=2219224 RepID=A0A5C4WPH7_9ACTN|nr:hypothetical protein FH608_012870 [Nonomuraea phyllanthi]